MPRLIGLSKAKDLIFTGRILNGKEAHQIGLVNYTCPSGKSNDHSIELATLLLEKGIKYLLNILIFTNF